MTREFSPLASLGQLNLGDVSDADWDAAAAVLKDASARVRARLAGEAAPAPAAEVVVFPSGYPLRMRVMSPPNADDVA